jgi:hypothetical protein
MVDAPSLSLSRFRGKPGNVEQNGPSAGLFRAGEVIERRALLHRFHD